VIKLTDEAIVALIHESKQLPSGYRETLIGSKMKKEDIHKRGDLKVIGADGNTFYIKVRISTLNVLNFSVILGYEPKETTSLFLLRRYNGKSHEHTNKIEGHRFRDFHIHYATERYQARGFAEETYAEVTTLYSDLGGALNCFISDCNFLFPSDEPLPLF